MPYANRPAQSKVQVQVPEPEVRVQVPITPDKVQPKYWSMDNGW